MWAKFKIVPSEREVIFLPDFLIGKDDTALVKFGGKKALTDVEGLDDFKDSGENSYENPYILTLTDKLKEKLLIQESLTYQIKIDNSVIIIGPVIGLLLGTQMQRYTPMHMEKYSDRLGIYDHVGGLIYAFSPASINWKTNTTYGLFYNIEASKWEYGNFPLPDVVYRRDFHSDENVIRKLEKYTGNRLFNSYRFTKYELFDFIELNDELREHLPPTELSVDFNQIKSFTDRYEKVILKPLDLSRGRGLCIIEKEDFAYKIIDYRFGQPITSLLESSELLERFFSKNQGFFENYLIQKYLPLAKIGDSVFDVRVVMQKHKNNVWGCTGIECRVSKENGYITNISRGGRALTLEESLQLSFDTDYEAIPKQIDDFCQKFCIYMDTMGKNFAEFGIDIAIDTSKNLWLIEANVFPSFKGFKKLDRKTYLDIRYTPMLYALSLTPLGE